MKQRMYSIVVLGLLAALIGCYPAGPEYVEELDIAYSNYDKTFDFLSKGTYSMPDSIRKITGDLAKPKEYVNPIYAKSILAQIDANMQTLGWKKVAANTTEDVQLLPGSWSSTTIIYGGYYGGYYCWYYPYYCGGGYGWYYPYSYTSSYTTGTLVMTMVDADPNSISTDGSRKVVWTGAINGLLSGTYNVDRITKGIDQTFKQSTYLNTK